MPLPLSHGSTTILVRKGAFERSGLTRVRIDASLTLVDDEFRVEKNLIAIGPVYDHEGLGALIEALESAGLEYFEDYCEMSGNWPGWVGVLVMEDG